MGRSGDQAPGFRGGDERTRPRVHVCQVRRHIRHGLGADRRRPRRAALLQRLRARRGARERVFVLAQPRREQRRRTRRRARARRRRPGAPRRPAHVAQRDARRVLANRDGRRAGWRRVRRALRRQGVRRHRGHRDVSARGPHRGDRGDQHEDRRALFAGRGVPLDHRRVRRRAPRRPRELLRRGGVRRRRALRRRFRVVRGERNVASVSAFSAEHHTRREDRADRQASAHGAP
mmetsp:Transcript_5280/g.21297  ORF Transcript_5280/g.21297 Transcript_5280/m.21297 type:complete len:233 (+) Transcript_5280:569-1267(+)